MTTFTQTLAWCTSCAELAHSAHSLMSSHTSFGSRSESCHKHLHSHPWAHFLDSPLLFYFHLFFPIFSFYLLHSELYPELDNLIVMESLCCSANKESDDAYDVSTSLTLRVTLKQNWHWKYKNRDQHRVLPLLGGNGKNLCGLPEEFTESREGRGKQRLVIDLGNPLFTELWRKPLKNGFHEFILFVTARSFIADVGLL